MRFRLALVAIVVLASISACPPSGAPCKTNADCAQRNAEQFPNDVHVCRSDLGLCLHFGIDSGTSDAATQDAGVDASTDASVEVFYDGGGPWTLTGSLSIRRDLHTALRLNSGEVLVIGGSVSSVPQGSTELYDPAKGQWRSAGLLTAPRVQPAAVVLDDGDILVVGGRSADDAGPTCTNVVEIFHSDGGGWANANALPFAECSLPVAKLLNGDVLVASGGASGSLVFSVDGGSWSSTAAMTESRSGASAVTLADGGVLVVGGDPNSFGALTSETFDGVAWMSAGAVQQPRFHFRITRLVDGRVLLSGGYVFVVDGGVNVPSQLADMFDPATRSWHRVADMRVPRAEHEAVLLGDGRVLVAGGDHQGDILGYDTTVTAEVYDPQTDQWTSTFPMAVAKSNFTLTLLNSGRVLSAGGYRATGDGGPTGALNTAEVY